MREVKEDGRVKLTPALAAKALDGCEYGNEISADFEIVSEAVREFFSEAPEQRHVAVLFRGKIYVACPRHMDAINLAFAGMTRMQKHRVGNRIADGKEELLFGTALGDGSGWEHHKEFQNARMRMYGFA